jgi:cytochrome c peroxidase
MVLVLAAGADARPVPPVPVPPQNPITESKRVLGKILFWDAQLSSDNTTACGTCHVSRVGGTDPRISLHPGLDGIFLTADDKVGSRGVIRADADDRYAPDAIFGLDPQVTRRAANPSLLAMFSPELFWDGRASQAFTDPQTGQVVIPFGAALESQALAPIVSDVEMGHEERDWTEVSEKLAAARPLALATSVPPDMAAAIAEHPSYPELFADAFGTPVINARRIAFAIATYERTLVPDDTAWDRFVAGDASALTPQQQAGLNTFLDPASRCSICHVPPLFTNGSFQNIGLRPIAEDQGRREVTGDFADRGRFKVPTLRNVGSKPTFMHTGHLLSLEQVLDFYLEINGQVQFPENQSPLIPLIAIAPAARPNLVNFIRNGLVDRRVTDEEFPFDRPVLHTELLENPAPAGGGVVGSGDLVPRMIATSPPNIGSTVFRVGVRDALGGAEALVVLARRPEVGGGLLVPAEVHGPIVLDGAGAGAGYGTWSWPIPDDPALRGDRIYLQWWVMDPAAAGGIAASDAVALSLFEVDPTSCGCRGDLDCGGAIGFEDLVACLAQWGPCGFTAADLDDTGDVGFTDLVAMLSAWGGCLP